MNYLLDTCVSSEPASKEPNAGLVDWIDNLDDEQVFIGVITIGESKRGVDRLPNSTGKDTLEKWFNKLLVRFENKIVSLDTRVILTWAELTAQLDRQGTPLPALDSMIAASVKFHQLILATRNVTDFQNAWIKLCNPWQLSSA